MDERKDILMITEEEMRRYQVIGKILDRQISQQEAAGYLGLSDRQVRRIVRRVRQEGERGVTHKLRGQKGCHRIAEPLKHRVLWLYRSRYPDFGPTLASEKLLEREKVKVNDETLRLWLIQAGLWEPRQASKLKKRSWRERKDHLGEMVQVDGSQHDWLEGRGGKLVLMGYIDDATGRFFGRFYEYEGTLPAMASLRAYIKRYGIPGSIYLDKHSTYKNNQTQRYKDWPFRDKEELTQFGRACQQLGMELIYAHSPQAKGRIERVFETLQDRLVKELRLEGADTDQQANEVLERYLGDFNNRFGVPARKNGDFHRRPDAGVRIEDILCIQTEHVLRNDRTVAHEGCFYQVLVKTRSERAVVHEYPDGRLAIRCGTSFLPYKPIENRPAKPKPPRVLRLQPKTRPASSRDTYWRVGFKLPGSLKTQPVKIGHF